MSTIGKLRRLAASQDRLRGDRIEGCGGRGESLQTRTLRYALTLFALPFDKLRTWLRMLNLAGLSSYLQHL